MSREATAIENNYPVRVCPCCGASWTLMKYNSIGDTTRRTRCPNCGTNTTSHFFPRAPGDSYPRWDEENHRWRWEWPLR